MGLRHRQQVGERGGLRCRLAGGNGLPYRQANSGRWPDIAVFVLLIVAVRYESPPEGP